MKDEILRQQKMLCDIKVELETIISFLIGSRLEENVEGLKEECFTDTIKINSTSIEEIKNKTDLIKEIIMGGNN